MSFSNAVVYIEDDTDATFFFNTNASTPLSISLPVGASGTWQYAVTTAGQNIATSSFVPSGGAVDFNVDLADIRRGDGSLMYTASSSPLVEVNFDLIGNFAYIDVGNGSVTAQTVFDTVEDALLTEDGLKFFLANGNPTVRYEEVSGRPTLFIGDQWRVRRRSPTDTLAQIDAEVISSQGQVIDDVNGSVTFVLGITPASIAQAVWGTSVETFASAGTFGFASNLTLYANKVVIDTVNGVAGSVIGLNGTVENPCDNLADAITLAGALGITTLFIRSDLTIDADVSGLDLIGDGTPTLTLTNTATVERTRFELFVMTGQCPAITNQVFLLECIVIGLLDFKGVILDSLLTSLTLSGETSLFRCASNIAGGGKPTIDFQSNAVDCQIRQWNGGLAILNANQAATDISVDLVSGSVQLASSVNNNPTIVLRGTGDLVNDSTNVPVLRGFIQGSTVARRSDIFV